MPQYKLTYFNFMALGEPIRYILNYGGMEFEDDRIDREKTWPKLKPEMPYGQMPVLEIDGKTYHQTLPICFYLGKQFNIAGKTDLDSLRISAIANTIHDLRKAASLVYWESNPEIKRQKREIMLNETLPYYLKRLETDVKNNGGYFHGGELSYVDLFFAALYEHFNGILDTDILKDYSVLKQLVDKVHALPRIAEWIAKRPKTKL